MESTAVETNHTEHRVAVQEAQVRNLDAQTEALKADTALKAAMAERERALAAAALIEAVDSHQGLDVMKQGLDKIKRLLQ